MLFSENELILLNSISGGGEVFGLPISFKSNNKKKEIANVINNLINKGLLKSKMELSPEGVLAALALEEYRTSKRHVIINRLHIAFSAKGDAIVLLPINKGEYELFRVNKEELLVFVLRTYKFLCEKGDGKRPIFKRYDIDEVLKDLYGNDDNIVIGVFENKNKIKEEIIYYMNNKLFLYRIEQSVIGETNAPYIRRELVSILDINM